MSLSERDRRAIKLGIIGVLIVLILNGVVLPQIDKWRTARGQIRTDTVKLAGLHSQWERLNGLRARLEPVYGSAVALPLEEIERTRVNLHETVQKILKSGGIGVRHTRPHPVRPIREIAGVVSVAIELEGNCETPQLIKCLDAMRQSESLIIIDSIDLTNSPQKPGKLTVKLVLSTLAREAKSS